MSDRMNELLRTHAPTFREFFRVDGMELYHELLPLLAEGRPVSPERVAAAVGRSRDEVVEAIHGLPDVEFDDAGRVIGAGLTLVPTRHRFRLDDRTLYTWCAWDALVYPPILGRTVEVESTCPATGQTIRLTVATDGVSSVEPTGAVMTFPDPDPERVCHAVRETFCERSNFYRSVEAAQRWKDGENEADVVSVKEGFRLGRAMHAEWQTEMQEGASEDRELACELPVQEQKRQREEVASGLYTGVEEVRELEDGFAFRFPSDDEWVCSLSRFMLSERECCPFYRFELVLEAEAGATWLHLRGGEDVKQFTREQFLEHVSP